MRRQNSTVRVLILVFAVLIAIVAIFDVVYYFVKKNQLQSIALQPEFTETSLEVGTQYTFKIVTEPGKANIKKANAVVDDPTCSFEIRDDQAILTTGMNEGNVTVYIECKDLKSQVLTFAVVDSVARAQAEAAAAAEEEKKAAEEAAAAAAEAEAAVQMKKYVKSTGDDVNVRSTNSTDGDVLGKAKKGDMFEKVEDVDDWTHIMYKGQDGYMKSEFLTEISEEEFNQGPTEEDKKTEDEKKEEKKTEATTEESQTQTKEEAEAKAAADAKKAEEDAAKAAAEMEALQQQLAAAAVAAGHSVTMKDGVTVSFTSSQYDYLKGIWPSDTDEFVSHHTSGEIKSLVDGH